MSKHTFLDRVFAAKTPEESRQLYDEWATSYDSDMTSHNFTAPRLVAEAVPKHLMSKSPSSVFILDAGCGSGAVGLELHRLGYQNIDGLDISQGMLDVAAKLAIYKNLKIANLTEKLELNEGVYDALVCCGMFTHGHLGKEPMEEFLRVVSSGGVLVASVLDSFWVEGGFAGEIERLKEKGIVKVLANELHAYRKDAGGGRILALRKV